ncbi:unnamed protein product [Adineta steineri]|uniref:G-protein coupled receptors family 1 profile domain-containing protein n=1 Tax=Adineta steineri TaxID=433720 RepID=A0A819V5A5_9BILA|nr:unnamed protein product [Adineta steineri]
MSSSLSSYTSAVQYIVTYMGMSTVLIGVVGNTLNIVVFISLKTFRENSCAFYLMFMSFVNIGQLITGQLSRVLITGFSIDLTIRSAFYCKFRAFGVEMFQFISLTCLCLATIDQFLATCSHVYWQQFSNIKLARRLTVISTIFWILYSIPYLIFYNQIVSSTTNQTSCTYSNVNFQQYHVYMNNIILSGGLPLLITVAFGSLAYRNVRQIAYRTIPLVRRELDKQLTNMVLIQIIFSFFTLLPYFILNVVPLVTNINPSSSGQFILSINIAACIFYVYFAYPFYIYACVSKRFRQQLFYVLFELHFNRWRRRIVPANDICLELK